MNINELDKYFKEYTSLETFYKELYIAKQEPNTFKEYLDNLDPKIIKTHRGIIPELNPSSDFLLILEEDSFLPALKSNVQVSKHDRYTPVFKHKHRFFEMIYVYSGKCTQNIMGDTINLNKGDICIVSPDVEHSIGVFDDSVIINILIKRSTFDNTFLEVLSDENILSSFFSKILYTKNFNNYIIFRTNNSNSIKTFISYMFIESIENKKYSNKMLEHFLMILYTDLLRDEKTTVELPKELQKSNEHLSEILIYIQNNYKTVTLEDLSKKFNFAVAHLSRLIKQHTGHNFKEMIQALKLNKAIELLATSELKIQDISEIVGYENTTHFIRTFKKVYGMSPNQYRVNILNKT